MRGRLEKARKQSRETNSGLGIAALWAATVFGIQAAVPQTTDAAIISPLTPDSTYVQNGAALTGAGKLVSVTATVQGFTFLAGSGVPVAPNLVLLAAHEVAGNGLTADGGFVSTASNDQNLPGGVTDQIKQVIVFPGFDSTFNHPDIAIAVLANDLPFSGIAITSTAPAIGSMQNFGGFGLSAVEGGTPTDDGNARGWKMIIISQNPNNVSGTYFISGGSNGEPGTANGYGGDSGGAVIDSGTGKLDGIMVAQDGGNSFPGDTSFDNLAQPDIHAWVMQNIQTFGDGGPNVPEPSSVALLALAAGGLLGRRKRSIS